MAQSDFACLAVQYELADESMLVDEADVQCSSLIYLSQAGKASMEACTVNYVTDELIAFLSAYESSNLTMPRSSDQMALDEASTSVSQDILEPARFLNDFAPPKRFHRTFWRSMARRILALSSMRKLT